MKTISTPLARPPSIPATPAEWIDQLRSLEYYFKNEEDGGIGPYHITGRHTNVIFEATGIEMDLVMQADPLWNRWAFLAFGKISGCPPVFSEYVRAWDSLRRQS